MLHADRPCDGVGRGGLRRGHVDADAGGGRPLKTDMDLMMAAAGLRGIVVEAPPEGGPELAVKTDAMVVQTSSEATGGGAGGKPRRFWRPEHQAEYTLA